MYKFLQTPYLVSALMKKIQSGGFFNNTDINTRPVVLDKMLDSKDNFIKNEFKKICKNENYIPSILPETERIVVVGDIHGDLKYAIKLLVKVAKVAEYKSNKLKWIGGSTYVVQVGDQIDRCRPFGNIGCDNPLTTKNDEASDIKIIELFNDLHRQAVKDGGAVISLLGNHEIMNSLGQLQYVSHEGLKQFENYKDEKNPNLVFNNGIDARTYAFAPGHEYGKLLGCTRVPAVIIGSNLFVHAGIVDGLIEEIGLKGINDFESINLSIRKWLLGLLDVKYVRKIINGSKYSMFWTRILGSIPSNTPLSDPVCMTNLGKVLKMFKVGGIIIGHTPQSFAHSNDINATCDNKIWRVDNGGSGAFDAFDPEFAHGHASHSRRAQVLEILNDKHYRVCDENECKDA